MPYRAFSREIILNNPVLQGLLSVSREAEKDF